MVGLSLDEKLASYLFCLTFSKRLLHSYHTYFFSVEFHELHFLSRGTSAYAAEILLADVT